MAIAALRTLVGEGLVEVHDEEGVRLFTLTESGRTAGTGTGTGSSSRTTGAAPDAALRGQVMSLAHAARRVARTGSPDGRRRAGKTLADARERLEDILKDQHNAG
ncbi:hypothetical protein ABZ891_29665 [Streptomyces sp. NPDC047023]|uniref:hypothetical protein n=1 Tax=Streptomyces sp. NPDC047023 TaxID=3155139 RepID=UPI0033D3C2F3